MSFLSENVIPGDHGKKFTTDAVNQEDLTKIHNALMGLDGIKDVIFEADKKPTVFVVHTNKVVTVKAIENTVKLLNLHVVPMGAFFPLF